MLGLEPRKIVMEALSAQLDAQSERLERERAKLTDEQAQCHADREELVKIREWLDAERRDLDARSRRDRAELREDREELAEEWRGWRMSEGGSSSSQWIRRSDWLIARLTTTGQGVMTIRAPKGPRSMGRKPRRRPFPKRLDSSSWGLSSNK